jgi:uncharacterized protein (TIGR04255 family)
MEKKIPLRLEREPLLEVVWEVRFTGAKPSVADLLPGLIYQVLPDKYPDTIRLPAADIPAAIAEKDPNLRYAPKIRLVGGKQAVQIGEHVLSLSCRRPYSGWKTFASDIRTLIGVVRRTGLVERLERFSLKYIDLIDLDQPPNLGCLNIALKLAEIEINTLPLQFRTEIKEDGLIHIIQIISPAEVALPGDPKKLIGVLLDTDSINIFKENGAWEEVDGQLDIVHWASKKMFFNLLAPETIEKLEPRYQE